MEKADLKPLEKQIANLTMLFEKSQKVVLKGFKDINRRFEQMDRRFDRLEYRFNKLEKRFDKLELRIDRLELRIDDLEQRFENRMKAWELRFEKHTQLTEDRFTNLLNICTALRVDMNALRQEWARFLKKQEDSGLEAPLSH
ncbi:MAG: hypothetical protein IT572_07195 [Deltaproteobacteria bacterium]|nr:hypothetical protein [Deltaproteobacteria bacterium]